MIFHLACDYDETLASGGQVVLSARDALARLRLGGSKAILVTGRELEDLITVFPDVWLFDMVVAENGAVLYRPDDDHIRALAGPPSPQFLDKLRHRGVQPLATGRAIVATKQRHYAAVYQTIAEMDLPLDIILNRDSLMILPQGIDKSSGLTVALEELQISAQNVVGVGDAENDAPFLMLCGCSVAVANALPTIQQIVDAVTDQPSTAGVMEVIDKILSGELCAAER